MRVTDRAGQRQVETGLGAVAVHAGEQNFARAAARHLGAHATASRPVFLRPPWLYTSQPSPRASSVLAKAALGINGHHDALGTVFVRRILNDLRIGQSRPS
jgi:hypothetical protein